MLGEYWVPSREGIVSSLKKEFVYSSMMLRYDIIIDNMNLNPKEVEFFENIVENWNNPKGVLSDVVRESYTIEFKDFFIPLQECIDRDSKRLNPTGEEVIRKTYEKYKDIIEGGK